MTSSPLEGLTFNESVFYEFYFQYYFSRFVHNFHLYFLFQSIIFAQTGPPLGGTLCTLLHCITATVATSKAVHTAGLQIQGFPNTIATVSQQAPKITTWSIAGAATESNSIEKVRQSSQPTLTDWYIY